MAASKKAPEQAVDHAHASVPRGGAEHTHGGPHRQTHGGRVGGTGPGRDLPELHQQFSRLWRWLHALGHHLGAVGKAGAQDGGVLAGQAIPVLHPLSQGHADSDGRRSEPEGLHLGAGAGDQEQNRNQGPGERAPHGNLQKQGCCQAQCGAHPQGLSRLPLLFRVPLDGRSWQTRWLEFP